MLRQPDTCVNPTDLRVLPAVLPVVLPAEERFEPLAHGLQQSLHLLRFFTQHPARARVTLDFPMKTRHDGGQVGTHVRRQGAQIGCVPCAERDVVLHVLERALDHVDIVPQSGRDGSAGAVDSVDGAVLY